VRWEDSADNIISVLEFLSGRKQERWIREKRDSSNIGNSYGLGLARSLRSGLSGNGSFAEDPFVARFCLFRFGLKHGFNSKSALLTNNILLYD
jgi:hypothetical protein